MANAKVLGLAVLLLVLWYWAPVVQAEPKLNVTLLQDASTQAENPKEEVEVVPSLSKKSSTRRGSVPAPLVRESTPAEKAEENVEVVPSLSKKSTSSKRRGSIPAPLVKESTPAEKEEESVEVVPSSSKKSSTRRGSIPAPLVKESTPAEKDEKEVEGAASSSDESTSSTKRGPIPTPLVKESTPTEKPKEKVEVVPSLPKKSTSSKESGSSTPPSVTESTPTEKAEESVEGTTLPSNKSTSSTKSGSIPAPLVTESTPTEKPQESVEGAALSSNKSTWSTKRGTLMDNGENVEQKEPGEGVKLAYPLTTGLSANASRERSITIAMTFSVQPLNVLVGEKITAKVRVIEGDEGDLEWRIEWGEGTKIEGYYSDPVTRKRWYEEPGTYDVSGIIFKEGIIPHIITKRVEVVPIPLTTSVPFPSTPADNAAEASTKDVVSTVMPSAVIQNEDDSSRQTAIADPSNNGDPASSGDELSSNVGPAPSGDASSNDGDAQQLLPPLPNGQLPLVPSGIISPSASGFTAIVDGTAVIGLTQNAISPSQQFAASSLENCENGGNGSGENWIANSNNGLLIGILIIVVVVTIIIIILIVIIFFIIRNLLLLLAII